MQIYGLSSEGRRGKEGGEGKKIGFSLVAVDFRALCRPGENPIII